MDFDVSRFIELINQGRIPGLPEDFTNLQDIAIIPGEEIRWVGEVSTDIYIFGPGVGSKYGAIEVLLGVSAYRIALFVEVGIIKSKYHFRSFWFEVDFGEEVWERGKLRKTTFTSLMMQPPKLKKGLMSREIEIKNSATLESGKQKDTFEGLLSSIKWRDPQQRKFVGGKADLVHAALMEGYENRIPVNLGQLLLMLTRPELLEEAVAEPEMAEGRAIRAEVSEPLAAESAEIQESVEGSPPNKPKEAKPKEPPSEKKPSKKSPAVKAQAKVQPSTKAPSGRAPAKITAAKKAQPKKASTEKTTEKTPVKKASAKKTSAKPQAPARQAAARKASTKPQVPARQAPVIPASSGGLTCVQCGSRLRPQSLFCGKCGTSVEASRPAPSAACPACRAGVQAGWIVCPHCGERLS